ncbi:MULTISPECIES: hypothetical protein [unclassified Bradyrhizobium]|uniref:hypothetical protein n=1 Tax=unclassified Bradyrhizobium TaxID=2631580 RepID=UPI002916B6E3|nr:MULTISPECIES: hypothetical protein [unclassified Bradyrhizobium]
MKPPDPKALIEEGATSVNQDAFSLFRDLIVAIQPEDPDRQRLGNESLLADIFGDNPVPIPRNLSVDMKVTDLLYRFLELIRLPESFEAIEPMARRHPWKASISRARHLENCWFLMVHEAYILEERLKRFLNCVGECAEARGLYFDKAIPKVVLKAHKESFGDLVAARGVHVHQRATIPREIERVALIDLLKWDLPVFEFFGRVAVANARKQLITRSATSRVNAKVLIAMAIKMTKPIWETVVREELKKFPTKRATKE